MNKPVYGLQVSTGSFKNVSLLSFILAVNNLPMYICRPRNGQVVGVERQHRTAIPASARIHLEASSELVVSGANLVEAR